MKKIVRNFQEFNNFKLFENKIVGFDTPNEGNFVFIAGGPGAGKSFVSSNLLNLRDYKYINVDTFRELIAKKLNLDLGDPDDNMKILDMTYTTSDPRNKTIKHLKNFLRIPKTGPLTNIVFDCGAGQTEVMKLIHSLAKDAGYETTLVSVETDLDIALQRNRERERTLKDDMVIDYHAKVKESLDEIIPMFDNVWVVDNSKKWDFENRPTDRIKKIV